MNSNKKLWHTASDIPRPKSSFILVHHYFGHTKVENAYMKENGYHFGLSHAENNNWWNWAWKIEKWCYVEDLLEIE